MKASYRKPIRESTSDRIEMSGAVAAVTRDIESRLLAAGLHDVRAWNNACADAGLTDESLAIYEHRKLFRALLVSADLEFTEWPRELFRLWNESEHFPFGDIEAEWTAFFYVEILPTGLSRYARMVAELHRRREAAREYLRNADNLMSSVFPVHELIDTETARVTSAPRVTVARRARKAVVHVG